MFLVQSLSGGDSHSVSQGRSHLEVWLGLGICFHSGPITWLLARGLGSLPHGTLHRWHEWPLLASE